MVAQLKGPPRRPRPSRLTAHNWHFSRFGQGNPRLNLGSMEVMTAMEAKPTRWNDDRLDEFATNVDKRFDHVDKRFDTIDRQLERVNDRLDFLGRAMIAAMCAITSAILAGFAGIIVLIATQI